VLGSSLDSEYCAYHFFSGGVFVFPNCLLVSMDNLFLQCRYMEENGHSSSITARAAHIIGRLGGLIRVFSCPLLIVLLVNLGVELFLKLTSCIKTIEIALLAFLDFAGK